MPPLRFGDVEVPYDPANLVLWVLNESPGEWYHVCRTLQCSRTAAHMRLRRAAEKIRATHPLLGATLSDVTFRGEWAMLSTTYHKM